MFFISFNDLDFKFPKSTLMGLKAFKRSYLRSKPNIWMLIHHLHTILATFSAVQEVYYCLLVVSFFTLVRPAEILFLKWKHINFLDCYIWLPWSKNDPYGARTCVTLLNPAFLALKKLASSYNHHPPQNSHVFPIAQSSLNQWLAAKYKLLNLPCYTWYATKHGGATFLALLGWSLPDIKDHGRWKSKASAKIYIHAPIKARSSVATSPKLANTKR